MLTPATTTALFRLATDPWLRACSARGFRGLVRCFGAHTSQSGALQVLLAGRESVPGDRFRCCPLRAMAASAPPPDNGGAATAEGTASAASAEEEEKRRMREEKKKQKEMEKQQKKERKAAAAAAASAAAEQSIVRAVEVLSIDELPPQKYGPYKLIRSTGSAEGSGRSWTAVSTLRAPDSVGQRVWVRARLQTTRGVSRHAFLVLRQGSSSLQAVLSEPREMVRWVMKNVNAESIVDVYGEVVAAEVKSCSQSDVELTVERLYVVSPAAEPLPFNLEDAARPADEEGVHVERSTRLDARVIDLRVMAHQAFFRIQSGVSQLFREHLSAAGFVEIHSPKLIGGVSEGGANVFHLEYFGRAACLAQSPQLYKQMAICGDLERVFEIGAVFRAENSLTHRHLCEFTGLDLEMAIYEHYYEVLRVLDALFVHIFDGLQRRHADEIAAVQRQYPFEPFKYRPAGENVVLSFPEAVQMLRERGVEMDDFEDLNTRSERILGQIVREKYDTDFFVLTRFPSAIRPFYTMPAPDDPRYSNSFDIFMRGEEITSGAQRVHDADELKKRIADAGISVESVRDYVEAFRYGAPPHAGAGIGLERVVMLFLNVGNVREVSMFPRDPNRLAP